MPKKKTVTQSQIQANRANARKSTGPKTPEGKAIVAQNSVTHGLTARSLVLNGDGFETFEDFDALLATLRRDLAPVGRLQDLLVERIAVAHWRLRRAWRFETSAILDLRQPDDDDDDDDDYGYDDDDEEDDVDDDDEAEGDDDDPDQADSGDDSAQDNDQAGRPAACDANGQPEGAFLPSENDVQKLFRYEGLIDRQLNRALHQLARLQSRRKAEKTVRPSLTTDL